MKKVIIYPGRFQPMLSHHAQVFDQLNALYNDAEVYIATSDKVEPGKSPFNFEEKKQIIASHGIDPAKVLYARSPYNWEELAQYVSDVENTVIYFAVGEKDMESNPRFKFDNLDDKGVNQKIKGGATYYQMINTYKDEPLPMNQRGYILKVPTITTEEEVASASAFRKAISTAPDKESAKLIFNKQFKQFDNNVFELVYNKIKGEKMSEDLNIMRKLAGLEVSEGAPIEFEDQVSVKDVNFAEVSKSSSKLSIANRFPEGSDVNDIEVKKEMYVKELLKSPVALLSEINERIMPDENGLEVSSKLNKILDGMRDGGIADLEAEDKGFVMDLVKHSLKNMELEAGDDREFDPETSSLESVDLDEIRGEYNIDELRIPKNYDLDQIGHKPKNFLQKTGDLAKKGIEKTGAGLGNIGDRMANRAADFSTGIGPGLLKPGRRSPFTQNMIKKGVIPPVALKRPGAAKLAQIIANNPKLAGAGAIGLGSLAAYGIGKGISKMRNRKKNNEMEEGKVKDMGYDMADDFYDKVSDIADETNDIQKAIIDSWNDEDDNPPVWALDVAAQDILADAGLIEPEPEEPYDLEPDMEESFDPQMEPSREEEAMNHVADGNFGQAAAVLGDTSPNAGDNLMGEWSEYCSLRGLDQKDTLNEFDHVENFVGEVMGSMDDKDYPAEMESIEEQENAIVGKALDDAMIDLKKLAGLY